MKPQPRGKTFMGIGERTKKSLGRCKNEIWVKNL